MSTQPPHHETHIADPVDWLDRYGDVLFRYAVGRVRNKTVAEDLVQETLLAGLRGRESFAKRSSQQTWLISILRRKIVDHVRRENRTPQIDGDSDSIERAVTATFDRRSHWVSAPAKWPVEPAQLLESREFSAALDDCLSNLPQTLADAFALREVEQLSAEKVCKILAISTSNLWTQLYRARILLRKCIEVNWFKRAK